MPICSVAERTVLAVSQAFHHRPARISRRRKLRATSLSDGLSVVTAGLSLVPLTILIDDIADRITDRVQQITNADANGTACYVAYPEAFDGADDNAVYPVVVLVHQIFGLQKREVELCDELASLGYIAVAVDTFNGKSSTWIPRAITLVYQKALTAEGDYGVPQVDAAVKWIRSQVWGRNARLAVAGFCYGGGCSIRYAVQHPGDLQAAVVFYGRPVNVEQAKNVRCPVLGIYGTADAQFPKETVDDFESALDTLRVDTKVERYENQKHAFVTDIEAIKKGGAPMEAWNSFLSFLDVHLRQSSRL